MAAPLEAGRIHSLPVQVTYHLQSSSQTFSTLFSLPQQVYVHPRTGSSRSDADEETYGAIYLQAIVQGVVIASPELHPTHPGTPDLSLYVLDPRASHERRMRATPHPRTRSQVGHEVWSGKGALSGVLTVQGKGPLVTGRIVRRPEFLNVTTAPEGLSALEALVAAHAARSRSEVDAWGIEISIGLKSSLSVSHAFPGPLHHLVENGSVAGIYDPEEDMAKSSPAKPSPPRPSTVARIPSFPAPRTASSSKLPPRPIPRHVSSSPAGPSRGQPPVPMRHKVDDRLKHVNSNDERSKLANIDVNKDVPGPVPAAAPPADLPPPPAPGPTSALTPAQASSALGRMTDDQKSVLTPDVLKFLEKLAGKDGAQIVAAEKRLREEEEGSSKEQTPPPKRARNTTSSSVKPSTGPETMCSNCGTTHSSVWRQQQVPGAAPRRVCNACGLYYQKRGGDRPPSMWQTDSRGQIRGRGKTKASDRAGFKRTLTQVAEKDSDRIVNNRRKTTATTSAAAAAPATAAAVRKNLKAEPQTSPARGSAPLLQNLRAAAATSVAATSSPGPWPEDRSTTPRAGPSNHSGLTSKPPMQSLAMPLSDDGNGTNEQSMPWTDDFSAFFNVEGFGVAPSSETSPASRHDSPSRAVSSMDARNVSSALRNHMMVPPTSEGMEMSEDDAFSELFNRTSSFGRSSSVGDHTSLTRSSSFGPYDSQDKFDFSQLPPSSPPAIPGTLAHSALLFSSPSEGSPADPSPRETKPSPNTLSGLRNEVTLDDKDDATNMYDVLSKLSESPDILDLLNDFPQAA